MSSLHLKLPRQVQIRTQDCVQCGSCYGASPGIFGADDDGTAFVHNPKGGSEQDIQGAMDQCAGGCIVWSTQ